jgi:preprotein translocase subunit YajC
LRARDKPVTVAAAGVASPLFLSVFTHFQDGAMSLFISEAYAQAAGAAAGQPAAPNQIFPLVFMVAIFVVFYFLAIRPQRKRQKEHTEMVAALAKGDEVVTTSGILGKVLKVEEDFLLLQVADNVELKFQKVSVHAVLPKGTLKSI